MALGAPNNGTLFSFFLNYNKLTFCLVSNSMQNPGGGYGFG